MKAITEERQSLSFEPLSARKSEALDLIEKKRLKKKRVHYKSADIFSCQQELFVAHEPLRKWVTDVFTTF